MLSERVRSASLAHAEADKNFKSVLENYNEKCVTLERVRELDEKSKILRFKASTLKRSCSTSKPRLVSSLKKTHD